MGTQIGSWAELDARAAVRKEGRLAAGDDFERYAIAVDADHDEMMGVVFDRRSRFDQVLHADFLRRVVFQIELEVGLTGIHVCRRPATSADDMIHSVRAAAV